LRDNIRIGRMVVVMISRHGQTIGREMLEYRSEYRKRRYKT